MTPSWGAQGESYLQPREWVVTLSYRHFHSFRDYHYSQAVPVPTPPELYASTHVNTFELGVTSALTRRLSLSLELPLVTGARRTSYEHDGVTLHTMNASGAGDMKLSASYWLFDPAKHRDRNLAVGLGVKMPTGDHAAQDFSFRGGAPVLRPVDPAIQPGDGGWGILLSAQGFQKIAKNTLTYFHGSYLLSPRETNGTQSPSGDLPEITGGDFGYTIDAVPDQYLGRAGISHTIWPSQGISLSFGGRIDGVPRSDRIGGSEGYRIPGYAIALEPGVSIARGKSFFTVSVPAAVRRKAVPSVADLRTGNPLAAYAAIADYQITASFSRRF